MPVEVREHDAEGIPYYEASFASPAAAELPLVVSFHGRGGRPQRPSGFYYGVRAPMRLVVPRGPLELGGGFAWFEANATDDPEVLAEELVAASERLARFVGAVTTRHATRGARIAAGFSQGGAVTLALALFSPHLVTHAFPLATFMPRSMIPEGAPATRLPIRSMHGAADPVVPFEPTAALFRELAARGHDVELHPFETSEHAMTAEMSERFGRWLETALA